MLTLPLGSLSSQPTDSVGSFVPSPAKQVRPVAPVPNGTLPQAPPTPSALPSGAGVPVGFDQPALGAPWLPYSSAPPPLQLQQRLFSLPQQLAPVAPPAPLGSQAGVGARLPLLPVPAGTQAVAGGEMITMPPLPASLTAGLVSPQEVAAQKEEFQRTLTVQLQQAQAALSQQTEKQREFMRTQAEQAKALADSRWNQHLQSQEMSAEREYQQEVSKLQEAVRQAKVSLQHQASQLLLEYNSRRAQEELNLKSYEIDLKKWETEQLTNATWKKTPEERLREQRELQVQLTLHHEQAQHRAARQLPELPLAWWEGGGSNARDQAPDPVALPYPPLFPTTGGVNPADVFRSSPEY